ncbi:MAG TPA: DotH/IcmK family type IV secretion protein [Alphaproteobacteria bacterium]|nr:DotH/IcmK family type IV secretion protein [Alphaproteobacteria bacterium]
MTLSFPAFAQDSVDLNSYLQQEEPAQTDLAPSDSQTQQTAAENNQAAVPPQMPMDVQSTDTPTAADNVPEAGITVNQGTGDALPPVTNTRLRIETEGFDYTAEKNINAEFELGGQDPNKKSQQELAEEIRREAFDAAITGLFPLKPENIKDLLKEYDKTKRAVEEPVHGIPTPRVNVETVSLDPGVAPMVIHTAVGHITTLNILDVTGAPWPVQDISWAGDFEVIEPEEGGHVIRITPMAVAAYGNMSIRLLTLKTPVTIMLKTGTDEVQYRVDARIPEFGPFATTPLIDGGSERVAGNATIMAVLDGVPPTGAQKLDVSGVDGRTTAYKISATTYVRTPLTLLSPGWDQSVTSADGMNVYALADTPVLLLSDKGRFMRASLSPGKDLFDE